jgi:hypothetical protein
MNIMNEIARAFLEGWHNQTSLRRCTRDDKRMRRHLSERQIDTMLADSFPASDPPSTY